MYVEKERYVEMLATCLIFYYNFTDKDEEVAKYSALLEEQGFDWRKILEKGLDILDDL